MRIGISTRGLNQGSYAISSIIYHLSQAICDLASKNHEIFLYLNDPDFESLFEISVQKRSIKINNRFIWDHAWLPVALYKDQIDVALFMKGTLPLFLPCKGAVIIHDLGYFDNKLRPYKYFETIYMKNMIAQASKKARAVFTDSEYTRQEAISIFDIEASKITVCYQNCSSIYKPVTDQGVLESIKTRYDLPAEFIFIPSSLSPRKNIDRILDAFEKVSDHIPQQLVITGSQSWRSKNLLKRINTDFSTRVQVLGFVEQEDMPALYSLARFTIYPSLLEGFGLPILEAFRCGCPVLTSNIASMPEVAGDGAYLVDPYDTDQISEGIMRLSIDGKYRQELISRGFERAKAFSWQKTAGLILSRLEKI